jgi:hypothetical protein
MTGEILILPQKTETWVMGNDYITPDELSKFKTDLTS